MSNIPVVIINRDRLTCTKQLIERLLEKHCNNIYIIDSNSSYQPLLNYYTEISRKYKIKVIRFYKNIGPFYFLNTMDDFSYIHNNKNFFYTDSDVVPIEEIPDLFLDDMNDMLETYNLYNLGLFLKLDDVRDIKYKGNKSLKECEAGSCLMNEFVTENTKYNCKIHKAITDTTFKCINYEKCHKHKNSRNYVTFNVPNGRTSYPYEARHMPWYYDLDNLPEDEQFYFQRANKYISTFYSGILS